MLDFRRTRFARLFGGSLCSSFGGLASFVFLAGRCARRSADSLRLSFWRLHPIHPPLVSLPTYHVPLSSSLAAPPSPFAPPPDFPLHPMMVISASPLPRTRIARLFDSSLCSTFGGLASLVFLAARCTRRSADSLRPSFWRHAVLEFRRTRFFHLVGAVARGRCLGARGEGRSLMSSEITSAISKVCRPVMQASTARVMAKL